MDSNVIDNTTVRTNTQGAVDGFEYEMLIRVLFMIKANNQRVKFKLVSNRNEFANFDDLVAWCEFIDGTKKLICVQVKLKVNPNNWCLDLNLLLRKKKDFNLENYFTELQKSHCKIKVNHDSKSTIEYVFVTNIDKRGTDLDWEDVTTSFKSQELLSTCHARAHTLKYNNSISNSKILQTVKEREMFLQSLLFLTNFGSIEDISVAIKEYLKKDLNISDQADLNIIFNKLCDQVRNEENKISLDESNSYLTEIDFINFVKIATEYLKYQKLEKLHFKTSSNQIFKNDIINLLFEKIKNSFLNDNILVVQTEDNSTLVTYLKVYQAIQSHPQKFTKDDIYIKIQNLGDVLNLYELEKYENTLIVVDCDQQCSIFEVELSKLFTIIHKNLEKRAIIIVKREDVTQSLISQNLLCIGSCSIVDFDEKMVDVFLKTKVTFQGVRVIIQDLLEASRTSIDALDYKIIEQILKKENIIIDKAPPLLEQNEELSYSGILKSCSIQPIAFSKLMNSDAFVIITDEIDKVPVLNYMKYPDIADIGKNVILYQQSSDEELPKQTMIDIFDKIKCMNRAYAFSSIHLLKYNNSQFTWLLSIGNVINLQKYVINKENTVENALSESQILKECHYRKFNLILENSGMEKCVMLKKLAAKLKSIFCTNWVIYCDLNSTEFMKYLEKLNVSQTCEPKDALNELKNCFVKIQSKCESVMFTEMKKIFCLNGLNKPSKSDENKIKMFLHGLLNNDNIQIYMASKEDTTLDLQNSLSTLGMKMLSMVEENEICEFKKYLKANLENYREYKINIYLHKLYNSLTKVSTDIKKITGMPLLLHIFFTLNVQNISTYLTSGNINIDTTCDHITELYDKYIEHKLRKINEQDERSSSKIIETHQLLAVKRFSHQFYVQLDLEEEMEVKKLLLNKLDIERFGIITISQNQNIFFRNSFAEYFLAYYVVKKFQTVATSKQQKKNLLDKFGTILVYDEFANVRKFINFILRNVKIDVATFLPEILKYASSKEYFHEAIKENNEYICELLMNSILSSTLISNIKYKIFSKNKYVNNFDIYGSSLLMFASQYGNYNVTKLLLDNGANVNKAHYTSPLRSAAGGGHRDVVTLLLDNGADIHDEKEKALSGAARKGHSDVVSLLLDRGADIKNSPKALISASRNGHSNVVSLLLDRGAEINGTDDEEKTALIHAAREGHTDIVSILLNRGASVHLKDIYGKSALSHATFQAHVELLFLLLHYGADINDKNTYNATIIMFAALNGNFHSIPFLISKGVNINDRDNMNNTALHKAVSAFHRNLETVTVLLRNHADVNIVSSEGDTALTIATYPYNCNCIPILLQHGGNINHVNNKGNSALHLAVKRKSVTACKFLVNHSTADVNIKNKNGQTPLQLANQMKLNDCINVLTHSE